MGHLVLRCCGSIWTTYTIFPGHPVASSSSGTLAARDVDPDPQNLMNSDPNPVRIQAN